MTRDERIMKDLTSNLRDKLARNISDFVSLCECAGLDPKLRGEVEKLRADVWAQR